jgi:acetylornithine deacetylase
VVCGPGSMDQGHKPDEFVTIAQLEQCDSMMQRIARFAVDGMQPLEADAAPRP